MTTEDRLTLNSIHARMEYMQQSQPTLRDQFAMAALTGSFASDLTFNNREHRCEFAYQYADAMLKERDKVSK